MQGIFSTESRSSGSGVDQKAHWKVKRGREWVTFEELPRDGLPGNPEEIGREEIDASSMGPRCPQGGRIPGAPVQAKRWVSRSERDHEGHRGVATEGISEMETLKGEPPAR